MRARDWKCVQIEWTWREVAWVLNHRRAVVCKSIGGDRATVTKGKRG